MINITIRDINKDNQDNKEFQCQFKVRFHIELAGNSTSLKKFEKNR